MASVQLELRDVTLAFDGKPVLDRACLSVAMGESVALIGPSGLGKTLILKLFAGLLTPDAGEVLIDGEDLARLSGARRTRRLLKTGMLFQRNALFDSLTAFENIAFPLRETTPMTEDEIKVRADEYLGHVGLLAARDLRPASLSGGMQKRLGIARALALEPLTVLYDDPTAGLDPVTSRTVIDLILDLRRRAGSTIVTVTNDVNRAYQLADRIVAVFARELVDTGSPAQTRAHPDPRVRQFTRGLPGGPLTDDAK